MCVRRCDRPGDTDCPRCIDGQQLTLRARPERGANGVAQRSAGGAHDDASVCSADERHLGMGHRQIGGDADRGRGFGGHRLEEAKPSRGAREQLVDLDLRTDRARRHTSFEQRTVANAQRRRTGREGGACRQAQVGDGGDARQRLTAKSERADAHDVGGGGDLRGRVSLHRKLEVVARDAGPVIDHSDADEPPAVDADVDA